jgi:hypothetical protein
VIHIPDNRLVDLRLVVTVSILPARPVSPAARWQPGDSLQRPRLASGKLKCALPTKLCENGLSVARAAG